MYAPQEQTLRKIVEKRRKRVEFRAVAVGDKNKTVFVERIKMLKYLVAI